MKKLMLILIAFIGFSFNVNCIEIKEVEGIAFGEDSVESVDTVKSISTETVEGGETKDSLGYSKNNLKRKI